MNGLNLLFCIDHDYTYAMDSVPSPHSSSSESPQIPKVHGHRGARGRRPENTIPAIIFAIESLSDGIEVDLCISADGVVVAHHDMKLSPHMAIDENGHRIVRPIPIADLKFEEIRNYDVGQLDKNSNYGKPFNTQLCVPDTTVPSLIEIIDTVLTHAPQDVVFNLELKGSPDHPKLLPEPAEFVNNVADIIRRREIANRTFVQSFDWQLIRLMNSEIPELLTGALTDMQPDGNPQIPLDGIYSPWTDHLTLDDFNGSVPRMVAATGAKVWSSNFRDLSPELVSEARETGLQVYCWTVNEIADMKQMIKLGVDVITTDYPDRLIHLLNEKKF